jgi:hypothetical protein
MTVYTLFGWHQELWMTFHKLCGLAFELVDDYPGILSTHEVDWHPNFFGDCAHIKWIGIPIWMTSKDVDDCPESIWISIQTCG